jgi:hypothetical protein
MFKVTRITLFFILSSLVGNSTELPRNVSIQGSIPSWIEIIEADYTQEISMEETSEGVYYLLSDRQAYPEKGIEYQHYALRLTSTSGVEENSSISVAVDPDYQQLIWHKIDIVRNGERIDQLTKQQFRTSSNQQTDDLIYDNRLSCLAIIEGTKKGDVIEYAYSIIGHNPILHERYTNWFSLTYSVPVARISGRIVRDLNSRPLNFKVFSNQSIDLDLSQPKVKEGKNIYYFDRYDVVPIHADRDTPSDHLIYSYLQVNDWKSWGEVVRWGTALYDYTDVDIDLPDELQSALSEWQKLGSDKAKVSAALRWVQEEIRYVAIVIGPHNFKPYSLEQTLERGFGDCKDKTQLFCYLLTNLGIDAVPTLVNTSEKGLVSQYLPTPLSFDHVITRVNLEGQSYWLDPTYSSQGGSPDNVWHADYTFGLELALAADKLTSVPGQGADYSRSFTRETFEIKDYRDAILFAVYSRYSGAEADSQRRYFNSVARLEVEKGFLNYYAQQFPGIKASEPIKFSDDLERNIIEVNEYYTIPGQWTTDDAGKSGFQLDTYPNLIDLSLYLSDTRIRTMPAVQSYPLNLTQIIEVVLPEPGTFEDEKMQIDTPWFTYSGTVRSEGKRLTLRYAYANLVSSIPAADYSSYAEKIDEVIDSLGYSITYSDTDELILASNIFSVDPYPATFLSVILFGFLGLVTAGWIVKLKRRTPKPAVYPDLDGISGWLILPAIGIFITPIVLLVSLFVEQKDYFDTSWVQTYTVKISELYIPGFEVLLLCEIGFNAFCLILSLSLIYVFVKKRAILPLFYISFSVFITAGVLVDILVTNHLLTEAGFDPLEDEWIGVSKSIVSTVIWSTYFAISDRVRSTFRH